MKQQHGHEARQMRTFLLFRYLPLLLFFASCVIDIEDNGDAEMYRDYVVSAETLAATGLPTVSVQTKHDEWIVSEVSWISATMTIANAATASWNCAPVAMEIRGRGNSTWGGYKRPYALRLSAEQSLCGMPAHCRWVLIANYYDNSFIKNELAYYLSRQLGMDYTVRGEFVNLVLNGNYVGLYWLGEAILVAENRVAINDESDYLLEIDSYFALNSSFDFRTRFQSALQDVG